MGFVMVSCAGDLRKHAYVRTPIEGAFKSVIVCDFRSAMGLPHQAGYPAHFQIEAVVISLMYGAAIINGKYHIFREAILESI